ncbi:rhamnulose-1-phosphate aldolase [Candidatus Fermentibacterales bacterium]|nr:rhamnulose-1-phosphate aldolase [Candidatus Fermentibacterales bacterium]
MTGPEHLGQDVLREIDKVSEVSGYLWRKGWAERNGGNISVNLTGLSGVPAVPGGRRLELPTGLPFEAGGMTFFVTGKGERLRDLGKPPRAGGVIVLGQDARSCSLAWSAADGSRFEVTSEFVSHVMLHLDLVARGNGYRAVVHTHPTNLIALSHHPAYGRDETALTRTLWGMLPEVRAFVPGGIAIAPYTLPGSAELARLTVEALRKADVVLWSKHGATASGRDAIEAFDFIDVADKGASVLLACLAAGYEPEGLSDEELRGLEDALGL